ncbi:MAG: hypothetical protein KBT20_03170 [Bacteroidales bacterium]|nr:hypothetical protein [Candidatus Liminaster caballi]
MRKILIAASLLLFSSVYAQTSDAPTEQAENAIEAKDIYAFTTNASIQFAFVWTSRLLGNAGKSFIWTSQLFESARESFIWTSRLLGNAGESFIWTSQLLGSAGESFIWISRFLEMLGTMF